MSLNNRFEDIMTAITFAEAGEHEKAREFLRGKETILLAVSEITANANVFKYVLSLSKRINAHIEILDMTRSEQRRRELQDFISDSHKSGISCRSARKDGCMKKAILEYTRTKKEILFVVVGSALELDIECRENEKTLSEAWKKLKCPMVVVTKGEAPYAV